MLIEIIAPKKEKGRILQEMRWQGMFSNELTFYKETSKNVNKETV